MLALNELELCVRIGADRSEDRDQELAMVFNLADQLLRLAGTIRPIDSDDLP